MNFTFKDMNENTTQSTISVATLTARKLNSYSIISQGEIIYVFDANLIRLLSKIFQASYKILIPSDEAGGVKVPNGNWIGMLGLVKNSEADQALGGIVLTNERIKNFNFSYPYLFSDVTFMTNKPKSISTSMALLYPFSFAVWMSIEVLILRLSFSV